MSEENKDLEQVEAEVVHEGEKAKTMEDVASDTSSNWQQDNGAQGKSAGTAYEEKIYPENKSMALGIISLILGIFSILCCCSGWVGLICAIASIILGIVSIKNEPAAKTIAIIGIVCGGIGTALGLITVIFAGIIGLAGNALNLDPDMVDKLEHFGDL